MDQPVTQERQEELEAKVAVETLVPEANTVFRAHLEEQELLVRRVLEALLEIPEEQGSTELRETRYVISIGVDADRNGSGDLVYDARKNAPRCSQENVFL